jgi:hypothetical protein
MVTLGGRASFSRALGVSQMLVLQHYRDCTDPTHLQIPSSFPPPTVGGIGATQVSSHTIGYSKSMFLPGMSPKDVDDACHCQKCGDPTAATIRRIVTKKAIATPKELSRSGDCRRAKLTHSENCALMLDLRTVLVRSVEANGASVPIITDSMADLQQQSLWKMYKKWNQNRVEYQRMQRDDEGQEVEPKPRQLTKGKIPRGQSHRMSSSFATVCDGEEEEETVQDSDDTAREDQLQVSSSHLLPMSDCCAGFSPWISLGAGFAAGKFCASPR